MVCLSVSVFECTHWYTRTRTPFSRAVETPFNVAIFISAIHQEDGGKHALYRRACIPVCHEVGLINGTTTQDKAKESMALSFSCPSDKRHVLLFVDLSHPVDDLPDQTLENYHKQNVPEKRQERAVSTTSTEQQPSQTHVGTQKEREEPNERRVASRSRRA